MINTTDNQLVFLVTGKSLTKMARAALDDAASTSLHTFGFQDVELTRVTTSTHLTASFAKFVRLSILSNRRAVIDEAYITDAYAAYSSPYDGMAPDVFYRLTFAESGGDFEYRKLYGLQVRRGLGLFLIELHNSRAITLPYSFSWPRMYPQGQANAKSIQIPAPERYPELIRFVRSFDKHALTSSDEVYAGLTQKQQERFLCYGTKLVLALGWLSPKDANYADLLVFKKLDDAGTLNSGRGQFMPIRLLVTFLERQYPNQLSISALGWDEVMTASFSERRLAERKSSNTDKVGRGFEGGESALAEVGLTLADFAPGRVSNLRKLPWADADVQVLSATWAKLQDLYLRKIRRESYKNINQAIGYLNLYLFAYLPHWYSQNEGFQFPYPDEPSKLLAGVFVSDLGLVTAPAKPLTFVEFLDREQLERKRKSNDTTYVNLRLCAQFFAFLEHFSGDLPGCKGFRQPIGEHDYPPIARPTGTNKRPIPRRLFSFYLAYVEALLAHTNSLIERILSGKVSDDALNGLTTGNVIDAEKYVDAFGYVPSVEYRGKTYTLKYVPNTLWMRPTQLVDGRVLRLPQPHALNHVLVILHTGIRNNHIQWLDAATFDRLVDDEREKEFTRLWVNTDKTKPNGWDPHVLRRVIDILRSQLQWRKLVREAGFEKLIYYNNNPQSKWGCFFPLFSATPDGLPHPDSRYDSAWRAVLAGVQGMLNEIGEPGIKPLLRLLPPPVPLESPIQRRLLEEYGQSQTRVCQLLIKTAISPHSARVSVVSHLYTVLPAEIIGKYITGQTTRTVRFYVRLEPDELAARENAQHEAMRSRAFDAGYSAIVDGRAPVSASFIRADDVNSNLSRSLRMNLEETLISYGGVSLVLNPRAKSGLDILRATRAENAVENKTEICPYGNNCPQEILVELRGWRRCALCPYAVRTIDHLQAVAARRRQVLDMLDDLTVKLNQPEEFLGAQFSSDELDAMEDQRQQLSEEATAWELVEEMLELTHQRIKEGADTRKWVVLRPEIIERDLSRVPCPSNTTQYLLARLPESIAYPMLESPQVRARFDLMRREILAKSGRMADAFSPHMPADPAGECLGLIRTVVAANRLTQTELLRMLDTDEHLEKVPHKKIRLLEGPAPDA